MDNTKNLTSCFRVNFLLNIVEKYTFWHYHCGAVPWAKNLKLWSGTKHYKVKKNLIDLSKDLTTFSNLTRFKHFGSSTCSHVHVQTLYSCCQHKANDCFCSLWIYRKSKMFETRQILLVLFCLKKRPVLVSAHAQSFFSQMKFDKNTL